MYKHTYIMCIHCSINQCYTHTHHTHMSAMLPPLMQHIRSPFAQASLPLPSRGVAALVAVPFPAFLLRDGLAPCGRTSLPCGGAYPSVSAFLLMIVVGMGGPVARRRRGAPDFRGGPLYRPGALRAARVCPPQSPPPRYRRSPHQEETTLTPPS